MKRLCQQQLLKLCGGIHNISFTVHLMMWIFSQDVQMIKALYNFFPYTFFEFEIYNNLRGHVVSYRSISLSSPLNLIPSTYQETQS